MDRYYTMRPINLGGEVSGYRAELVGVGAGADALRTIMQTAIQRVGVSITPIVCQQLFVEVFNAAVDFACDSGTSVNLADIISFKWNTRGKYDRIDATVPKSALNLTAIVSPKITRNATPHFDLKAQPVEPTINSVPTPFDTNMRGIIARGFNLGNVLQVRVVDAVSRTPYVEYIGDGVEAADNGRSISISYGGHLHAAIPEGANGQFEVVLRTSPTVGYTPLGPVFALVPRAVSGEVISATPQPWDPLGEVSLVVQGTGLASAQSVVFVDFDGDEYLHNLVDIPEDTGFSVGAGDGPTRVKAWVGGALVMQVKTAAGDTLATFNVNVAAFSL